jgi:hypothetical protein
MKIDYPRKFKCEQYIYIKIFKIRILNMYFIAHFTDTFSRTFGLKKTKYMTLLILLHIIVAIKSIKCSIYILFHSYFTNFNINIILFY